MINKLFNEEIRQYFRTSYEMTHNPDATKLLLSAYAFHDQNKLDEAALAYRQSLFFAPELVPAYIGLAEIHQARGELDDVVILYEQALFFAPNDGVIYYNLGLTLTQQNKIHEAIAKYERAIALQPNLITAYNNLGMLLQSLGRLDEAHAHYEKALALDPQSAHVHNNIGTLYHAEGNLDQAIAWYKKTLEITPDYLEAIHNLGDALVDHGDIDAALLNYNRALAANPNLHHAIYSKATVQLLLGDFANGWEGYEARWTAGIAGQPMREYPWPLWDGTKPAHGKVLIWGEQGIGDEVMFAGLIPDAARCLDNACVIDCANARVTPWLARSFPNLKIIAGTDPGNDIAAHIPISSLPRLFRKSDSDFANTTSPYLVADPVLINEFRARYGNTRRIGIAWHTASRKAGRWRSIPLTAFKPLFEATGKDVQWINLQYGDANILEAEIRTAGAPIFVDRSADQLRDMDRFAAQIAAIDLVITIDNTTAHVAGALGVPTWLLLPFVPNWRWQLNRTDSPWYPSVKLFRQPSVGDWGSVIQDLVQKL